MNKQTITTLVFGATFTAGLLVGGFEGYGLREGSFVALRDSLKTSASEVQRLKRKNLDLHVALINRDNPYDWKPVSDGLGGFGYVRDGWGTFGEHWTESLDVPVTYSLPKELEVK